MALNLLFLKMTKLNMISSTAPIVVVRDIICNINKIEIDIVTTAACKEWQTFHSIKTHHTKGSPISADLIL